MLHHILLLAFLLPIDADLAFPYPSGVWKQA
jgi:hypothetical protein